jgi:hypothetical protein
MSRELGTLLVCLRVKEVDLNKYTKEDIDFGNDILYFFLNSQLGRRLRVTIYFHLKGWLPAKCRMIFADDGE